MRMLRKRRPSSTPRGFSRRCVLARWFSVNLLGLRQASAAFAFSSWHIPLPLDIQVEEAKRDADAARSELDAANERLARLDELEAEAAGLRADLRLRQDDANRGEAAAEKLQVCAHVLCRRRLMPVDRRSHGVAAVVCSAARAGACAGTT